MSWRPVKHDYGDLFTLEDFQEMEKYGAIIDGEDGDAYPAKIINGVVHESREWDKDGVTHIMWYNK